MAIASILSALLPNITNASVLGSDYKTRDLGLDCLKEAFCPPFLTYC